MFARPRPAALLALLVLLLCATPALRAQDGGGFSTENPEAPPDTAEPDWQPWRGGPGLEFTLGYRHQSYSLADFDRLHRLNGLALTPGEYPVVTVGFAGELAGGWRARFDLNLGVSQTLTGQGNVSASHRHIGGSMVLMRRLNPEGRWPLDVYLGLGIEYWDITMHYRATSPARGPQIADIWGVAEPDALTNRSEYISFAPQLSLALRRFPLTLTAGYSIGRRIVGPRLEWGDRVNITDDDRNGEPEFVAGASVGTPQQLGMFFVSATFRLHFFSSWADGD